MYSTFSVRLIISLLISLLKCHLPNFVMWETLLPQKMFPALICQVPARVEIQGKAVA